jgi:hypothetical protein
MGLRSGVSSFQMPDSAAKRRAESDLSQGKGGGPTAFSQPALAALKVEGRVVSAAAWE